MSPQGRDAGDPLTVAISPDIPPYVVGKATAGIEVDLLRELLPGRALRFLQMPYADLQTAVPRGLVEVSAGVQRFADDGVHYSDDFVAFENAAIAKKTAGLELRAVADLQGRPVLAWQDAWQELGPDFERLYAPDSPERRNYAEIADQSEQVRRFWEADSAVAVIDRHIFSYLSGLAGHFPSEVRFYPLFPGITTFKVGFVDAGLRDQFDAGLAALNESGGYTRILARYHIEVDG